MYSDVVAVAGDANGTMLAAVRLSGGDPYSFTAPLLAWAAGRAAAGGVRPAGALGPVEAFGLDALEAACASAGFHRESTAAGPGARRKWRSRRSGHPGSYQVRDAG
jgi:hypothetical protein